jgi:methionyl-tRNA synthetase
LHIGKAEWQYTQVPAGLVLGKVELLFERIDKQVIQEEEVKLKPKIRADT